MPEMKVIVQRRGCFGRQNGSYNRCREGKDEKRRIGRHG